MSVKETLYKNIVIPIIAFKKTYIPIIILYFIYGFSGFTSIAQTFWIKNDLSLSASKLVQLAFWAHLPWTYKIIFSQFADNHIELGNYQNIGPLMITCTLIDIFLPITVILIVSAWQKKYHKKKTI